MAAVMSAPFVYIYYSPGQKKTKTKQNYHLKCVRVNFVKTELVLPSPPLLSDG